MRIFIKRHWRYSADFFFISRFFKRQRSKTKATSCLAHGGCFQEIFHLIEKKIEHGYTEKPSRQGTIQERRSIILSTFPEVRNLKSEIKMSCSFWHQCLKQYLFYWKSLRQRTVVLIWNAEGVACKRKRTWVESFEINRKAHDFWWDFLLKHTGGARLSGSALWKLRDPPRDNPH